MEEGRSHLQQEHHMLILIGNITDLSLPFRNNASNESTLGIESASSAKRSSESQIEFLYNSRRNTLKAEKMGW